MPVEMPGIDLRVCRLEAALRATIDEFGTGMARASIVGALEQVKMNLING